MTTPRYNVAPTQQVAVIRQHREKLAVRSPLIGVALVEAIEVRGKAGLRTEKARSRYDSRPRR